MTCHICGQPIESHMPMRRFARWREDEDATVHDIEGSLSDRLFDREGSGRDVAEMLAGCIRALAARVQALESGKR